MVSAKNWTLPTELLANAFLIDRSRSSAEGRRMSSDENRRTLLSKPEAFAAADAAKNITKQMTMRFLAGVFYLPKRSVWLRIAIGATTLSRPLGNEYLLSVQKWSCRRPCRAVR